MGLEAATHISDLVATNPTGTDQKLQGDDHIRMLKSVLKTDFPNITGPITGTQAQLNALTAIFPLTDDYYIRANGTAALELRTPAQVRSDVGADNASNLSSGTIPEARLPGTLALDYSAGGEWNFDTEAVLLGSALTALPAGITQCQLFRAGAFAGAPSGFATGTAGHLVLVPRSNAASALGLLVAAGQQGVDQAIVLGVRLGVVLVNGDNVELRFGAGGDDMSLYHDGSNNNIDANTGHLILRGNGTNSLLLRDGSDTNRLQIESTNGVRYSPVSGPASSEIGFRRIVRQTTGGTLSADMVGTCQAISAGPTVPNSVFAAGDAVQIYNNSAAAITITQGAGVTLRLAGTTTTGNRTLAPRGFAMLWWNSASECICSGNVS